MEDARQNLLSMLAVHKVEDKKAVAAMEVRSTAIYLL